LQRVAVNETRWRSEWLDLGRDAAWQVETGQAIKYLLPREIAVGRLVERDVDARERVQGNRAQVILSRDAVHLPLDGNRNQPLNFFGRVTRPLGGDRNHRRRQIGIGIDRQTVPCVDAGRNQKHRKEGDEDALFEAERDEAVDEG
jgi:hypothetical protein